MNLVNVFNNGAVNLAARSGKTKAVSRLIEAKANINAKENTGATALLRALEGGFADTSLVLLDSGADVSQKVINGSMALHFAVQSGFTDGCRRLLELRAEVDASNFIS